MPVTLTPQLAASVSRCVEAQFGLHFPPERRADLEKGLCAAAQELEFQSVNEFAEMLVRSQLSKAQIDLLGAHLTIGETYFFRDEKAFAALEGHVLPALGQQEHSRGPRLRIWSAGCCTGEEPYSIAIALRRALPRLADSQVTILATDLNARFLHKAAHGVYGKWSFRGVPPEIVSAYFRLAAEGRWEVIPEVKKLVTFASLNLVEDAYPSLTNNTNAMDVIFCRNVLMYLSRDQAHKVIAKLHRSLVDGGWLFATAAEASPDLFAPFTPAGLRGTAIYRKQAAGSGPSARRRETPEVAKARALPSPPGGSETATPAPRTSPARARAKRGAPQPEIAVTARQLANEGRLDEALRVCEQASAANKLVPAHHYLQGVILQEQGAFTEAAAALRRALYLDPDFVIALFALGHVMLRQGRKEGAERYFENARALLKTSDPERVLPESDGLTAGRLLAMLSSAREVLT